MASERPHSVEQALEELSRRLRQLVERVDRLQSRIDAMGVAAGPVAAAKEVADGTSAVDAADDMAPAASAWTWIGTSGLPRRLAMTSFVLVVALLLRSLTDSGAVGTRLGITLGIAYSLVLLATGAVLLQKRRRGQRVLPICGGVLFCAVVLEAHGTFSLIAAPSVHWGLLVALGLLAALGLRHEMGSIVAIPTLTIAICALVPGFPNLPFVPAALVLLAATLVAHAAQQRLRLAWLPWATFTLATFFWALWTLKVRTGALRPETMANGLQPSWFLPVLGIWIATGSGLALLRTIADPRTPDGFTVFAPTANVLLGYGAAFPYLAAGGGNRSILVGAAATAALIHFAVAHLLWRRQRVPAVGITALTLAGASAAVLAVMELPGGPHFSAPAWALLALILFQFARTWSSPGLHVGSFLLQIAALVLAIAGRLFDTPPNAPGVSLATAGAMAAFAALHYHAARRHAPPDDTWLARLDRNRHASIVLLWLFAANAFCLLRLLAWHFVALLGDETPATFQCAQTVVVNLAGVALLLAGMRSHNHQMLLTAGLAAVYGGLRVFGSDMLSTGGLPLVLSVFSFGVLAAVGSLTLGRLQSQRMATP